jgi:hypothetical protein
MPPIASPRAASTAAAMAVVHVARAAVPVTVAAPEEEELCGKENTQNETFLLEEKSRIQEN